MGETIRWCLACMPEEYYTKSDFRDELDLDERRFDQAPADEMIDEVVSNIEARNIDVYRFASSADACDYLAEQISADNTVMNGHSTTLKEIGFMDVLEAADGFEYLGNQIEQIDDDQARTAARRNAVTADVFYDGVNAIAESGELLGANALGNAVSAWPYAADQLILISSTNKIMPSWAAAVERIREYALPLEDARAQEEYGQGSTVGKLVSLEEERVDDRTQLVLLDDAHGF